MLENVWRLVLRISESRKEVEKRNRMVLTVISNTFTLIRMIRISETIKKD